MYVLDCKKKLICKMNLKKLDNFLNELHYKKFENYLFFHKKEIAKNFIKNVYNIKN